MELLLLITEFLLHIDRARGRSRQTVSTYRIALGQLTDWMVQQGLPLDLEHCTASVIRDFLGYLRDGRGNDGPSIRLKLAAVKSWLHYLRHSLPAEHRHLVPVVDWNYHAAQNSVHALEREELDRLLAAARARYEKARAAMPPDELPTRRVQRRVDAAYRDYVLVLLLAGTGLRVGELVALNCADVDRAYRSLEVKGKGGRQRRIWWDVPTLVDHLSAYLDWRQGQDTPQTALFRNERDGGRLSVRSVERTIAQLAREAGLRATPHTLRHTFATLEIESGANIKAVAQMLGHSHVSTTLQFYTHLSTRYVRQVFALCHPFATTQPTAEQAIAWRRRSLLALADQTGQRQRQAIAAT